MLDLIWLKLEGFCLVGFSTTAEEGWHNESLKEVSIQSIVVWVFFSFVLFAK